MNAAPIERRGPAATKTVPPGSGAWPDRVAWGLLAAVVLCRLLTPTDGAALGETIWIAQFTFTAFLAWVFAAYRSGRLRLQFDAGDGAVLLLCLGHVVGALAVIFSTGDQRAALNMLWEWCAVAITYFLMRRLPAGSTERRSLLLVVAAAGVSLSGLGLWQHYAGYADSRKEYGRLKSQWQSLERAGRPADAAGAAEWERAMLHVRSEFARMGIPEDESARMMWEQRLDSSEPIGMFALANTLAGILVGAIIVWLGTIVRAGRGAPFWQVGTAAACAGLILYCLLLTKSRTAYVGLAAGLTIWGARGGLKRSTIGRLPGWVLAALLAAVLALVAVALVTGGLDRFVLSESGKSLKYRAEYWTGTWHMLINSPRNWLLGVGPGNFRDEYLPFKLPQSSEEIADPHNLVLDVWANGGLLALIGLAGICGAGLRPIWRPAQSESSSPAGGLSWADGILAGAVLGHVAVLASGSSSDETIVLLLAGWVGVVATCGVFFGCELPPLVFAAAFASLVVHLLGAGGIGMPGVLQLLLWLMVAGRTGDAPGRWQITATSRWPVAGLGLAGLGLYFGCWFTGLTPVIAARAAIADAEYELSDERRPAQAEQAYRRAAQADPWSSRPFEALAHLAFQTWQASTDAGRETFERSLAWQRQAISRNPRNSGLYRTLGQMYLALFAQTGEATDASQAAEALTRAATLYPNSAQLQADRAEALWKSGQAAQAREAAQRARELDAINERAGHIDKQLSPSRRKLMGDILSKAN